MTRTDGWFDRPQGADTEQARHDAEDCGRLVEVSRMEKGWTVAQLAAAAGVTEVDVEGFEAGRTFPVEPMLSQCLRAMGHTS
jgi:ribosome-binding protein aMBF1 (putative translation factor)